MVEAPTAPKNETLKELQINNLNTKIKAYLKIPRTSETLA